MISTWLVSIFFRVFATKPLGWSLHTIQLRCKYNNHTKQNPRTKTTFLQQNYDFPQNTPVYFARSSLFYTFAADGVLYPTASPSAVHSLCVTIRNIIYRGFDRTIFQTDFQQTLRRTICLRQAHCWWRLCWRRGRRCICQLMESAWVYNNRWKDTQLPL